MITREGKRVNNSLRAKSQMRWYEHLWYIQYSGMWWQLATSAKEAAPFLFNLLVVVPFTIIQIPYSFYAVHKARKEMKQHETK